MTPRIQEHTPAAVRTLIDLFVAEKTGIVGCEKGLLKSMIPSGSFAGMGPTRRVPCPQPAQWRG